MKLIMDELKPLLRCPRCNGLLEWMADSASCRDENCALNAQGAFPFVNGQPVLVDFDESILDRRSTINTGATSLIRRAGPLSLFVKKLEGGTNKAAEDNARRLLELLPERARVLIIGGGTVGNGADLLYESDKVDLIGTDIYASDSTQLVADAHQLPFVTGSIDGVWIQAVLEHVLDPNRVVAEIHRVLKPGGLVFSDTPFMQHVHEGAYDYTRFTASGHRWLFRRFDCIEAGVTKGAGTTLIWSIRYFARAVTGSNRAARLAALPFFWLRFFDGPGRQHGDAASGVHFLGRATHDTLRPADIVRFYEDQNVRRRAAE